MPLLVGTDGTRKMSKSFGNSIGLTDSAEAMFTKLLSLPDSQIVPFFELATSAGADEVAAIRASLAAGVNPKAAKEALAKRLIRRVSR